MELFHVARLLAQIRAHDLARHGKALPARNGTLGLVHRAHASLAKETLQYVAVAHLSLFFFFFLRMALTHRSMSRLGRPSSLWILSLEP